MPVARGERRMHWLLEGGGEASAHQDVYNRVRRGTQAVSGFGKKAGEWLRGRDAPLAPQGQMAAPAPPQADKSGFRSSGSAEAATPGAHLLKRRDWTPEELGGGKTTTAATESTSTATTGGGQSTGGGSTGGGAAGLGEVAKGIFDRIAGQFATSEASAGEAGGGGSPAPGTTPTVGPGGGEPHWTETLGRGMAGIGQAMASIGPGGAETSAALGKASEAVFGYVEGLREKKTEQAMGQAALDQAGIEGEMPFGAKFDQAMNLADQELEKYKAESGVSLNEAQADLARKKVMSETLGFEMGIPRPELGGFSVDQAFELAKQKRALAAAKERAGIAASAQGDTWVEAMQKRMNLTSSIYNLKNKAGMDMMDIIQLRFAGMSPADVGKDLPPALKRDFDAVVDAVWGPGTSEMPTVGKADQSMAEINDLFE